METGSLTGAEREGSVANQFFKSKFARTKSNAGLKLAENG